jgi:hypothetical protein
MRVRIALGLALLATLIVFLIDMSGSAPRLAGSDHVHWPALNPSVAVAPPHTDMCVKGTALPADAATMLISIHGAKTLPAIRMTFVDTLGRTIATGSLPRGAPESGAVAIPLRHRIETSAYGTLCLRAAGRATLVYDGQGGVAPTTAGGVTQPGTPAILYYRRGSESWWDLLGALDTRFGLAKASVFGDWTLPVVALLALALFAAVTRLLLREMR